MEHLRQTLRQLLAIVNDLESYHKRYERKFTLDGHLFGSIGEVYAAKKFNLTLLRQSFQGHDAQDSKGNFIQIKVTQKNSVGLRKKPNNLLVLKLNKKTFDFETIYYDNGEEPWEKSNKINSAGQRIITLNKLKEIKGMPITKAKKT